MHLGAHAAVGHQELHRPLGDRRRARHGVQHGRVAGRCRHEALDDGFVHLLDALGRPVEVITTRRRLDGSGGAMASRAHESLR